MNHSADLAPESAWFKSSYSSGAEGNCVEAANVMPVVAVRDSKDKEGPAIVFPRSSWAAFVARVRTGAFDAPS
ncbi:DUF397 domain-containing protein [Streptomyces sp. NPDC006638]|uniref:DUF397 domain-containing protein n=1 Tax=Streptomyces sp. NPDC006638 TaxID=3157183 RepID=UPI0033BAB9C1